MGGWSSPERPSMRGCVLALLLEEEDKSARGEKENRLAYLHNINRPISNANDEIVVSASCFYL